MAVPPSSQASKVSQVKGAWRRLEVEGVLQVAAWPVAGHGNGGSLRRQGSMATGLEERVKPGERS